MLATQELLTVYLGVRLGLYDELAVAGPSTATQLAGRLGLDQRYLREWLEQQAVAGLLTAEGDDDAGRRFTLPPAHRDVLTVNASPSSMVSLTALPLGGVAGALPALLTAFRDGSGVPDEVYGDDWRNGHGGANRALFETVLPGWIARRLPDVATALGRPGSRVADVCCGAGWAGLAVARAFPRCVVDGFDLDEGSIRRAEQNARGAGVADRVRFAVRDAALSPHPATYDLVLLLDSLHEVARPADMLAACRGLVAPGGTVLVMDARVQPVFRAPADEIERFQYATSVLHCLPAGRAAHGSRPTGTVLRPGVVEELARVAGFARCEELPFDDRFHRVYRLTG